MIVWLLLISLLVGERLAVELPGKELKQIVYENGADASTSCSRETVHSPSIPNGRSNELVDADERIEIEIDDGRCENHARSPSSSGDVDHTGGSDSVKPCPICLEDLEAGAKDFPCRRCQVGYHKKCVDQWFKENLTCPICQQEVEREGTAPADVMETTPAESSGQAGRNLHGHHAPIPPAMDGESLLRMVYESELGECRICRVPDYSHDLFPCRICRDQYHLECLAQGSIHDSCPNAFCSFPRGRIVPQNHPSYPWRTTTHVAPRQTSQLSRRIIEVSCELFTVLFLIFMGFLIGQAVKLYHFHS